MLNVLIIGINNKGVNYTMTSDEEQRLEKIKLFTKMRYGRNINDVMDDMEFLIQQIEHLDNLLIEQQEYN